MYILIKYNQQYSMLCETICTFVHFNNTMIKKHISYSNQFYNYYVTLCVFCLKKFKMLVTNHIKLNHHSFIYSEKKNAKNQICEPSITIRSNVSCVLLFEDAKSIDREKKVQFCFTIFNFTFSHH